MFPLRERPRILKWVGHAAPLHNVHSGMLATSSCFDARTLPTGAFIRPCRVPASTTPGSAFPIPRNAR
ncbi:hypothetical protein K491DRAFT_29347 [Lophiostoma macrostomum CBS 122681]|uniref:Uncharacterized protein n=1 Tax=Lophiostoma macrostomum CBS 122681 TaxID=1314788 RepID=A0A6A6T0Q2_9PLEO|nr:hypothetical protein K491DRAFT_29347 [Lophiostoma macrostomum CBS 122681]